MSTGGFPGLQDGEWEELWDCWRGGVLNGEIHKIFLLKGEFEGEKNHFFSSFI